MTAEFNPAARPPGSDALISVVLPVFNEAGVLAELCLRLRTALRACRTTYEIIFVDDGSSDGSAAVLDNLTTLNPHVRVVHLSRNFGHQAAIQAGLAHARGDAVVLMDSDLQDAPESISKLLAGWQAGYDVVYAVRAHRREALWKRCLFAGFHRLLRSVSATNIPVDAGNFSLLDARVVREIAALGERDRYLPGLRSWVGFKQLGVPVERGPRYDHRPRVSLWGLVRLAKTAIFSFSSLPLRMFSWLGYCALALFLGVSVYSVYCKFFTALAVPGWTSQLVTMSFFAALNALGISMLGEYVVRIYDQVRARPQYLVDRKVNFAAEGTAEEQRINETAEKSATAIDLEHLDPLELDSQWDDAYQHLLDQASDLLEMGDLLKVEAADLGQRHAPARAEEEMEFGLYDGRDDSGPLLLKLPTAKLE